MDVATSSSATLPKAAVDAVNALAAVTVPTSTLSNVRDTQSDKGSDKAETAHANKAARKKETMSCYRCGEPGHFVIDFTAVLCDICLKPGHSSDNCPLLSVPKPVVTIYGVCNNKIMFFETPCMVSVTSRPEGSTFGLVKVTKGTLTEEQVARELKRLVSESFH